MKVTMSQIAIWCNEYRKRWNKPNLWDSYCLVGDAYLAGYYKAQEEIQDYLTQNNKYEWVMDVGHQQIETEIDSHQIGQKND